MINIVIFNGGRGGTAIIPSLVSNQDIKLTSIVNAYDDGKSTGEIRDFFNMLGPSDIRKVQELMLPSCEDINAAKELFAFRFPNKTKFTKASKEINNELRSHSKTRFFGYSFSDNLIAPALRKYLKEFYLNMKILEKVNSKKFSFSDCSLMNCIYAGAFILHNRNMEFAAFEIGKLFRLKGTVIPNSIENKKLIAIQENGKMRYSEAEIVELRSNVNLKSIYLVDNYLNKSKFEKISKAEKITFLENHNSFVDISSKAKRAISDADIIIYSPGTQHSSLYPTYMTRGLPEAISDNKTASKIFITNVGADYETPKFYAHDYVDGALKYMNKSSSRLLTYSDIFTKILVNDSRGKLKKSSVGSYVKLDIRKFKSYRSICIIDDFEDPLQKGKHNSKNY